MSPGIRLSKPVKSLRPSLHRWDVEAQRGTDLTRPDTKATMAHLIEESVMPPGCLRDLKEVRLSFIPSLKRVLRLSEVTLDQPPSHGWLASSGHQQVLSSHSSHLTPRKGNRRRCLSIRARGCSAFGAHFGHLPLWEPLCLGTLGQRP